MHPLRKSFFVSDFHLHSRRSSAATLERDLVQAIAESHTFVLGGDIFDFRWRTHGTLEDSIHESIIWLENLLAVNRRCRFHYLLGNHDAHPDFIAALMNLCGRQPQIQWHPHFLRIQSCAFLHGDIVDTPVRSGAPHHVSLDTKRRLAEQRPTPSRARHQLYDLVVRTRLHRLAVRVAKRKTTVLKRIFDYLKDVECGPLQGIQDVYFGHTHRGLDNAHYAGLRFHNPGATIKGLDFRMIPTRLPHPDGTAP